MSNSKKLCGSAALRETFSLRGSAALRETFIALFAIFLSLSAWAERQPYSRYEPIVERQMFGPLPEGFDPLKRPSEATPSRASQKAEQELSKEQQKLKSAIRFSMINMTPSGETAVGFTDSSNAKSPRNYYLKVNEKSTDGKWTVKEADPAASSMTIVSADGIEISLKIGGDSSKDGGVKSPGAAAPNASGRQTPEGSLSARRAQRRAERNARENAQQEAFNKKLQEQQATFERRLQEAQQAREAEKAQQDAQREEQRKQLLQIQEGLKRAQVEKENAEATSASDSESDSGKGNE